MLSPDSELVLVEFIIRDFERFELEDACVIIYTRPFYGDQYDIDPYDGPTGHVLIATENQEWQLDFSNFDEETVCHLLINKNSRRLIHLADKPKIPERRFSSEKLVKDVKREIFRRRRKPYLYYNSMTKKRARQLFKQADKLKAATSLTHAIKLNNYLLNVIICEHNELYPGKEINPEFQKIEYILDKIRDELIKQRIVPDSPLKL
ncbi:hypothetical protein ACTO5A_32455 [Pseudomonas aeruginosa]